MNYSEIRDHLASAFAALDAQHEQQRSALIAAFNQAGVGVSSVPKAFDRKAERARIANEILDRFCWAAVGEPTAAEFLRTLPNPPAWLTAEGA